MPHEGWLTPEELPAEIRRTAQRLATADFYIDKYAHPRLPGVEGRRTRKARLANLRAWQNKRAELALRLEELHTQAERFRK